MIRKDIAFSLGCQISHLIEHILNKNSISTRGIVDQHVGDGSDELAVLDDGRARHALNDTARFIKESRVGDLDRKAFIRGGVAVDL